MDYVVKIDGVDVVLEQEEANASRRRLLEYYKLLLQEKNIVVSDEKQKALDVIVGNMTEAAAKEELDSISSTQKRLMAYANAFSRLKKEKEETADALNEVLEATIGDEEQESILVNGNKFLFEKGSVDVNQYLEKLYSIGEEKKGNTWTIYVDKEGELVIY